MPNEPKKSSAYAEYLYAKVDEYFFKQGSAFTVQEFAEWAGLKPTCNMRRRLRHAVVSGKLIVSTAYAGRSSHGFVYSLPVAEKDMGIPF